MAADLGGQAPSAASTSTTMPIATSPPVGTSPPIGTSPPGTYRPGRPARGPGRWFRMCVGIDEDLMDWTPSERAKYTGLGIIVLNTGCLAAFAMFTALGKIIPAPAIVLAPVALAWGWIIFSADRWLITSTHGIRGASRALIFIPRLILAILLAFTIAEPLTLRIFQNTLDATVAINRTTQLDNYQSLLQRCNPVSGQWVSVAECADDHLSVANPPYAVQQKLASAKQQQTGLEGLISTEETEEQILTSRAQGECAGTAGADMSGQAGNGPLCKADRAAAHSYAQQSGLLVKQEQLAQLQTTIADLIQQSGTAQQTYATQLHAAITNAVAEKRKDLGTQVGIIDEWAALEQLSNQSTFVLFGHWLLVLVMLALDCLPVLAKLMSGSSPYDHLLAEQRSSDERIHENDLRFKEETATVDKEVEIYLSEMRKHDRMRNLDQEQRVRNAQRDTDGLDDVRKLAARWLREAEADG